MEYFLAVGKDGRDDHYWIVWLEGDEFREFVPGEDNFAMPRKCPVATGSTEEILAAALGSTYVRRAPFRLTRRQLPPGAYYPRIRRGELVDNQIDTELRSLTVDDMQLRQALISSASAARILYSRMKAVFETIEPTYSHADVYGNELRHLLILACTEVESAWRSILAANGYPMDSGKALSTGDYVKLLTPMQLDQWKVRLLRSRDLWILTPFEQWDVSRPTKSLSWYDSYNATKHDREMHLDRATLASVLHAMSALFVMLVAQFGSTEVFAAGLDDFVVEEAPRPEPVDAYIRNYRTDYGQVPLWRPTPLFGGLTT